MTIPEALKALGLQPGCSEQEAQAAFRIYAEKWHHHRFAGDSRRQAVARRKLQLGNSALHVLAEANFETAHVAGDFTLERIGDGCEYPADIPDGLGEEISFGGKESNHAATANEGGNTANIATIGLPHYGAIAICCLFLLGAGAILTGGSDSWSVMESMARLSQPPVTSSVAQQSQSSESSSRPGETTGHQLSGVPAAAEEASQETVSVKVEGSQPASPAIKETTQGKATSDNPVKADEQTFFLGSTPAQVARAQGTPNKVDGDKWYYGSPPYQSTVTFRDERVVEWNSNPNARLRVSGLLGKKHAGWPSRFTIGSHKTAVAAIQGAPERVTGDVWFFGQHPFQSKVTFKDDRVVTWEINPAKHLSVGVPIPGSTSLPGHTAYSQAVAAMYAIGRSQDPELANELFRQSANQGHAGACVELGIIYANGNGSIAGGQWDESDKWFRQAAETAGMQARQNDPSAMFAYAFLLARGVEEDRNNIAACEWLHQSGRMNHVPSLIHLARTLWDSEASPETTAFLGTLLRRALELDASVAGVDLACVLMLTKTPQQASSEVVDLLKQATGRNLAAAHSSMAYGLQNGWIANGNADGTPRDPTRSLELAYQCLLKAFRLKQHSGENYAASIARCLFDGNGISKDIREGMKYMHIACESDPWAMLEYADMIYDGEHVRKDTKTADTWYRRALSQLVERAKRGDLPAALEAAQCYEEGVGTNQDLPEARRLYRAAASSFCPSIKRTAVEKLLEYGDPLDGECLIPPF